MDRGCCWICRACFLSGDLPMTTTCLRQGHGREGRRDGGGTRGRNGKWRKGRGARRVTGRMVVPCLSLSEATARRKRQVRPCCSHDGRVTVRPTHGMWRQDLRWEAKRCGRCGGTHAGEGKRTACQVKQRPAEGTNPPFDPRSWATGRVGNIGRRCWAMVLVPGHSTVLVPVSVQSRS